MYVGWQNPTEREQMMVLQGYHQHQLHGFSQANQPQMSPIPWPQTSPNPQQHQTLKLQELLQFEAQRTQENRQFGEVRYGQENDDLVPGDLGTDPWPEFNNIEDLLSLAMTKPPSQASQLVSCIHSVAKLCDSEAGPGDVSGDPRIKAVLGSLRAKSKELTAPRSMMKVVWALGKLGLHGGEVEGIVADFAAAAPPRLSQFSPQELSNMLWGLARITDSAKRQVTDAAVLAHAVMREGTARLVSFSTQCLTNSLWAVAKLGLRGHEVAVFTRECVLQIHSVIFKEMSPQGLANSLWACAKIQCEGREGPILESDVVTHFCMDAARRATASENLLQLFFPQELSMALWGIAKLMGRRTRSGKCEFDDIEKFSMAVAREGSARIQDFSAQGVSIVAWALATLNLVEAPDAVHFFEVAAEVAATHIQHYPPQAIANLCWALNRVPGKSAVLASFGRAAALEAQNRMNEFSWQDSSGIVSALMNLGPGSAEVRDLTILLVQTASYQCHKIGTQALLNIALSAVRLKLDPSVVMPLAEGIAEVFVKRQGLNDIDNRQWQEVQRYCGFSTGHTGLLGNHGHGYRKGRKTKKK